MDVVMVGRMYGQIEMELVFHVASVVHRCSSAQAQLGIPGRATVKICITRNRFRDKTDSVQRVQLLAVGFGQVK
jgi:hypothetical protein